MFAYSIYGATIIKNWKKKLKHEKGKNYLHNFLFMLNKRGYAIAYS